jgi:ankyrin repeat protein
LVAFRSCSHRFFHHKSVGGGLESFATAIEKDDIATVTSLLENGSIDINARLPRPRNPPSLAHAVRSKRSAIVELLLNRGANIDCVDDFGITPCHIAASANDVGMVKVLLAHTPNLAATNVEGKSIVSYCLTSHYHPEPAYVHVAAMFVEAGAPFDCLDRLELCKFAGSSTYAIQALTKRGVVVRDLRDDAGNTPLHAAVNPKLIAYWGLRCDLTAVRMLIFDCGVDLEARGSLNNTNSFTALVQARSHDPENFALLRCLVECGADVNCSVDDATLLHFEIECERLVLLLAAGADVHARDLFGRTANYYRILDSFYFYSDSRTIAGKLTIHALVAAGAHFDPAHRFEEVGRCASLAIDADLVESKRREIAKVRLDFVRGRALQVCIGLQSRGLDALQMCEILVHACGPLAQLILFHHWWAIATTVKHFHKEQKR